MGHGQQMMHRVPAVLADFWLVARKLAVLSVREAKHWRRFDIPLQKRFSMWTKGFLSESLVIYGLQRPRDALHFVSDFERAARTRTIDGRYVELMDDKLLFWLCLRNFSPHIVPVIVALEQGRIVYRSDAAAPIDAQDLVDLLRGLATPVVIKPTRGGGGSDVHLYEFRDGVDYLNGAPATRNALLALSPATS